MPQPRLARSIRELARELRTAWNELDATALPPRIAAVLYLTAGALTFAVMHIAPGVSDSTTIGMIGVASMLFGLITIALPWQRWPVLAQLVFVGFAFVLFACGGLLVREGAGPYLAALPLPFVYIGFTQRPGMSTVVAPAAVVALLVAARFQLHPGVLATLVFALPMSVLVGEMIAQAELHRAHAEHRVDRLLHAVRVLARVEDERAGARLVASLAAELLGAQAVAVLLSDRPNGRRYLNRAFFGHPALADTAPLIVDSMSEEQLAAASTRFVSLRRTRRAVRAAAIVPLPMHGARPVGLVIAMWGTPRRRLNAAARQAAELLSEEAGRMFSRLRTAAALEHDAQTDPLTDLANRRTFTRALQTMQAGDALVIVDIDHFKAVNDRYGHQAGDATLRSLAACLRTTTRQVDCVARYGGEEFAVVLPEAGESGAQSMLDRLRDVWHSTGPATTFSAGIAVHQDGENPRMTLRRADVALYEAKERGRNRDVVADVDAIMLP